MKAINQKQILAYDSASRQVRAAADILESINVANINSDAVVEIYELLKRARQLGHELFHASHDAFIRARMGDES